MKTLKIYIFLLGVLGFGACKNQENYQVGADIRDSVYIYAKDLYLWNESLPDIFEFKPKNYSSPQSVIASVRTYSPIQNGYYVDRFSFVSKLLDWENTSSGNSVDYGCGYSFYSPNDLRISYVYENSAAGQQGVQRGWQLLKVNNIIPDTTQTTINQLNEALFYSNSVEILFRKNDNTEQSLTLTPQNYTANFLLHKEVINYNNRKIAYLVLNGFLGANDGKDTQTALEQAFSYFTSQGAEELVIDLRYNSGGYIYLAERLANLIAPANAKGQVMFSERWNNLYSQYNSTTYFSNEASTLSLSRVFFITTNSTASASELLINSLSPYLNVQIIGEVTAGKPVGFPVLPIIMNSQNNNDNYVVAPVAFQSFNANNFGDYFQGLSVQKEQIDDVTKNFGDTQEACLQDALYFISNGVFQRNINQRSKAVQNLNRQFFKHNFGSIKLMKNTIFRKN
ncbi:MAG: S41 family peptidase [Thermonemataceae bacterium]|nr:S41 family peptidase [Thermonemataceae bacterium]